MDVSYTYFCRLMFHWQLSIEANDADRHRDASRTGAKRKLIAQFGRSWPDACLVFEEE